MIKLFPFDPLVYNAGIELPLIYKGSAQEHFGGLGRIYSSEPSANGDRIMSYLALNNSETDTMKVIMKCNDESNNHDWYISTKMSIDLEIIVPPSASRIVNHVLPVKVDRSIEATMTVQFMEDTDMIVESPTNLGKNHKASHGSIYGGTVRSRGPEGLRYRTSQIAGTMQRFEYRNSQYQRNNEYQRPGQYIRGSLYNRGSQYHANNFQQRASHYHPPNGYGPQRGSQHHYTAVTRNGAIQDSQHRSGSIQVNIPKYRKKSEHDITASGNNNNNNNNNAFNDRIYAHANSDGRGNSDVNSDVLKLDTTYSRKSSVQRNLFRQTASTMDII